MPTIDNWRALREALDAGPTEGPMHADIPSPELHAVRVTAPGRPGKIFADVGFSGSPTQDAINAEFIAAAHPAAIRSLLDERDRLAAEAQHAADVAEAYKAQADSLAAEVEALRVALRFYATGEHFHIDPDEDWDSVSGEPENWLCSDRENSTTMLENGTVARMVLQGKAIDWTADGEDCTPSIVPNEAPIDAAMKGKP